MSRRSKKRNPAADPLLRDCTACGAKAAPDATPTSTTNLSSLEPRGSCTQLASKEPRMREHLLERISPLVDCLVQDLVTLLEVRIELEVDRMCAALDVALSAYASEESHADTDRPDHDPVSRLRRSSKRGLHDDKPRGQGRADSGASDGERPQRTQPAHQGREEGQRAAGLVAPERPRNVPAASPPNGQSTDKQRQSNGKAWPSCKLCGKVGVTARSHPAHVNTDATASVRSEAGIVAERRERIASRASKAPDPRRAIEDEEDEPEVRRSAPPSLADRTTLVESQKQAGMLPTPSSTYRVTRRSTGGLADVEEMLAADGVEQ